MTAMDFRVIVGIPKISSEKFVRSFIRCNQEINILREVSEIALVPRKEFFHFYATSE